ncbi:MAG TPA: putative LPS assembly protein LptD [Gemmatimonadaceae bacterium]
MTFRRAFGALVVAMALLGGSRRVEAQRVPGPNRPTMPGRPNGQRPVTGPRDTLRTAADSAKADTTGVPNFLPPDSVMQRLMTLGGYNLTRYQANVITFEAPTRGVELTGRALVERDSQIVKSDTIIYSGQTSGVQAIGQRNVFVVPGQAAPIVTQGTAHYDLTERRFAGTNLHTSFEEQGQTMFISGRKYAAVAVGDSLRNANDVNYYVRDGIVTTCDDSIPDYFFRAKEIKRTGRFVVARPAILYIGDVPILWLPFVFQDVRGGRHSGLLAPSLGVSDIIRNSPSYRRSVEGLGYYWAMSDYFDAQASLDWRSSAGETQLGDPGFMRYNGEIRYRWLERYIAGNLAVSQTNMGSGSNLVGGSSNTAITWGHQQNFTRNSSLTANLNYVTSTTVQRNTTSNPYTALATISSSINYQQKIGTAQISLGGTNRQYPGRPQVDRNFPTFSFTTSPINIGNWLTWTPNLTYSATQALNIDQPTNLGLLLRDTSIAGRDTIVGDTLRRNSWTSNLAFDTPLTIFGYNIGNRFGITSARNDFPERAIVTDVVTGAQEERIYAATYKTEVDWTPSFALPPIGRNLFNLTPSVALSNVAGSAFWIRNERTGGQWVHQRKRLTFGLSAAPTLFGLFDRGGKGFGPFARIRHSISPTFGYAYAPAATVSDEFLQAIGGTRRSSTSASTGYLPSLAQNSLNIGLSTNVEAKLRSRNDSAPDAGEKIKLVSVNFTGVTYDFERARATHSRIRGLTTQNIGYNLSSDLLPGVQIGSDYSLFQGSPESDTAVFKPFRERTTVSLSISNTNNPFVVLSRIFGRAVPTASPGSDRVEQPPDERYAREIASQPVAGRASRNAALVATPRSGWEASFNFTSARQRPPGGIPSNLVEFDPAQRCQQFNTPALKLAFDDCVARAATNPPAEVPITSGLAGSPFFLVPPTTSLGSSLSFRVTENWAASWQTNYDFVHHSFASQIVSLQRDLHDWRAIFAFTQSPNGSFAFNFMIALKAEPDLKFDYHKATYRNEGLGGF